MQFNFFQWIREGVRQSVLLGVSDAVDQIGTIPHDETFNQRLHAALSLEIAPSSDSRIGSGRAPRKRLGKSLKDPA